MALFGFAIFSIGDTVIKSIDGAFPPVALAVMRFGFGTVFLGILLALKEGKAGFAIRHPWAQILRGAGIATSTIMIFTAFFAMPLADATAILFVSPMITAALAAIFMGERAPPTLLLAGMFAFAGVMLIVRPGFDHFSWVMILPLGAAFGVSMLIIGNRLAAGHASSLAMQFSLAASSVMLLIPIAIVFQAWGNGPAVTGWPSWLVIGKVAIVTCTASFGHWLVYLGTTRAGASVVAPMTYVQLLMAMVLGLLVFGDFPDGVSLIGAAMIVAAGLWLWLSGRSRDVAETEVP